MRPAESLALYIILCSMGLLVIFTSAEKLEHNQHQLPAQSFSLNP